MPHHAADPQAQQIPTKAEVSTDAGPAAGAGAQASLRLRGRQMVRLQMDTLGIEPRASRMLSGCDTTTPCARCCSSHCCAELPLAPRGGRRRCGDARTTCLRAYTCGTLRAAGHHQAQGVFSCRMHSTDSRQVPDKACATRNRCTSPDDMHELLQSRRPGCRGQKDPR